MLDHLHNQDDYTWKSGKQKTSAANKLKFHGLEEALFFTSSTLFHKKKQILGLIRVEIFAI